MALALNRAKVASQRELAIAYWGLDEVGKHWATTDWMRALSMANENPTFLANENPTVLA